MKQLFFVILFAFLFFAFKPDEAKAYSCSFSFTDINFGTVDLLSGGTATGRGTLTMSCNKSIFEPLITNISACPFIQDGSGGMSGGWRLLRSGTRTIQYQLYQDSAYTRIWGSRQSNTPSVLTTTFGFGQFNRTERYDVYARIAPGQDAVPADTYSSLFSGAEFDFFYNGGTIFLPSCDGGLFPNKAQPSAFTVRATVQKSCHVSTQPIDFGRQGALTGNVDATGSLSLRCSPNLPYTVSLNGGLSNTAPTQRRMTLGNKAVLYGLYMDANRTSPWGSAPGQIATGTGTGAAQRLQVYGRVAPQKTPSPGVYSDTVVVTVNY